METDENIQLKNNKIKLNNFKDKALKGLFS